MEASNNLHHECMESGLHARISAPIVIPAARPLRMCRYPRLRGFINRYNARYSMFASNARFALGLALGLATFMSTAKAQYAVWYDYNDFDVPHGSMLLNGKKLQPPAYACGMRFQDPYRLNWIDYANFKKGVDLDGATDVWLPLPNCPKQDIVIAVVAMTAVLAGARWLQDCMALLRKSDLIR
jgi:hypothetical protein